MAGYLDLILNVGEDFSTPVALTDVNNSPINLANYIVAASMKKSYYTKNVAASFTCTTAANAASGLVTLSLPHTTTANLAPSRYLYDVMIRNTLSNQATKILEGIVFVYPSVTATP